MVKSNRVRCWSKHSMDASSGRIRIYQHYPSPTPTITTTSSSSWSVLIASSLVVLLTTSVRGVDGQTVTWVPVGGDTGRGCCINTAGDLATVLTKPSNTDSISQCRQKCESTADCEAIEYNKDTDRCNLFGEAVVVDVLLDNDECTTILRCQMIIPPTAGAVTDTPPLDNRSGPNPDTSTFSVQSGIFQYLTSFTDGFAVPFDVFKGRALLSRNAKGTTTASVSFSVGVSSAAGAPTVAELGAMSFVAKLHSMPCSDDGGDTYQNPYTCDPRCNARQVEASARIGSPVELHLTSTVNIAHHQEAIVETVWDLHIPESKNGIDRKQFSVVIYDPTQTDVPMVCADLEDDRTSEGLVYYINTAALANQGLAVPVVSKTKLTRSELGFTQFEVKVANLYSDMLYEAVVHTQPCLPFIPPLLFQRGGERYMRNIDCYDTLGDPGCENIPNDGLSVEMPAGDLNLPFTYTYVASTVGTFPGVARADAASVVLYMCDELSLTGCDLTALVCLDLVNESPEAGTTLATTPDVPPQPTTITTTTTTAQPDTTPVDRVGETDAPTQTRPSTSPPSASPLSSKDGGGGSDGGDGGQNGGGGAGGSGGSGDGDSDTTPAPRVDTTATATPANTPRSPIILHNPCGSATLLYGDGGRKKGGKYKEKKKKKGGDPRQQEMQLDFATDVLGVLGQCCLNVEPPANLVHFSLIKDHSIQYTSGYLSMIVMVMGGVVLIGGLAYHKVRQEREQLNQQNNTMEYAVISNNPYLFNEGFNVQAKPVSKSTIKGKSIQHESDEYAEPTLFCSSPILKSARSTNVSLFSPSLVGYNSLDGDDNYTVYVDDGFDANQHQHGHQHGHQHEVGAVAPDDGDNVEYATTTMKNTPPSPNRTFINAVLFPSSPIHAANHFSDDYNDYEYATPKF